MTVSTGMVLYGPIAMLALLLIWPSLNVTTIDVMLGFFGLFGSLPSLWWLGYVLRWVSWAMASLGLGLGSNGRVLSSLLIGLP